MKNFVLLVILCLAININLSGQSSENKGFITGFVIDSLTKKPMPFTTISLYQNTKLVNGIISDSVGRFDLKMVDFGKYSITFSAVGYHTFKTGIFVLNEQNPIVDLGILKGKPNAKNLETVTIRGQKALIEQRVDGITFNVESLPSVAGSDGADILRKVPLVSLDQNGSISMRGSTNIKVFIDGKPSDMYASSVEDALKAVRGENIVKIEVITNPSAKYDAEGTDGVINIITKKSRIDSANGNITVTAANRSESLMADIHSKRGKWLANLDGFYQKYWNRNGAELERQTDQISLFQKSESKQLGDYFFGGGNVLYIVDSLNTISAGYRVRSSTNATKTFLENYTVEDVRYVPTFQRNLITPFGNVGNSFNLGYNGTSKSKLKELSLLTMYSHVKTTNGYDLEQTKNESVDYRENFNITSIQSDFTLQADYSHTLNDKWKLESGGKLIRKNLTSESRFGLYNFDKQEFFEDAQRSNNFAYNSNVYAGYGSMSLKLKKWAVATGLRYEKTKFNVVFKNTSLRVPAFGNIVPNVLITSFIDQKTNLKIGYTTRLVRPYFTYLNPTINQSDSLTIQYGNPYLKPEITNRYQLSFTRTDPKLFKDVAVFFNDNRNSIENIRTPVSGGLFESTFKNVGKNRRLGLATTLTWKPSWKLTLGGTLTGQYVWLRSVALGISNSGFMRQLVINSSYKFQKGFSVDFYGFFDNKNLRLQGYRSGWRYYSLTVNKKSKNERVNMSLRMDTILTPHTFVEEEVESESYYQLQTYRYQNRHIRLSVSFKLGKKEIKSPKMRQLESGD